MNPARPTPPEPLSAHPGLGRQRLEAMTLRCDLVMRRRIESAFEQERTVRPQLSLGRFLAECVGNGLPGNLPSTTLPTDPDAVAALIDEILIIRLAAIENAIPVIADVLGELSDKLMRIESALRPSGDGPC